MKKIILKTIFLFFLTTNFIYSYDYSSLSEDISYDSVLVENHIDKYDYLIEGEKQGNNEKKLVEYINKAGFYKCRVFLSLEDTEINDIFIKSCTIFSENNDYSKALEYISSELTSYNENDIYNSFLALLYSKTGNEIDANNSIDKIKYKDSLGIFLEYIKFSLKKDYNEDTLLGEEYNYKDIFLYQYISDEGIPNSNFTVELGNEIFKYENRKFSHEFEGVDIVSFYQNVHLLFKEYYDRKDEHFNSLYHLFKFIEDYDDKGSENYKKAYDIIINYMINGYNFGDIKMKESDYKTFLGFLDENDEKVIGLYISFNKLLKLGYGLIDEKIDIKMFEEYANLIYCGDINEIIKEKERFIEIFDKLKNEGFFDLESINVCEKNNNDKKTTTYSNDIKKSNFVLANLNLVIFIGTLVLILVLFLIFRQVNKK